MGMIPDDQGLIVTNEEASTLVNNTALTRTITVPTNARWLWHGGRAFNGDDVARAISVDADDGTQVIFQPRTSGTTTAASGNAPYPSSEAIAVNMIPHGPLPLSGGFRINIIFFAGGASAGGTARSSAVVEEWLTE